MTEFLRGNVHQQIVLVRVRLPRGERLHEVLHRGLQFAIPAAELLQQESREAGIGPGDASVKLKLFDVMKHRNSSLPSWTRVSCRQVPVSCRKGKCGEIVEKN